MSMKFSNDSLPCVVFIIEKFFCFQVSAKADPIKIANRLTVSFDLTILAKPWLFDKQ